MFSFFGKEKSTLNELELQKGSECHWHSNLFNFWHSTTPMRFFSAEVFRKVIYFEWVLIFICATGEFIAWKFAPIDPQAPNLVVSFIFLAAVALLSFVVPIKSTYWDRMCFLFLEIALLTGSAASGLVRFVFPLYMVSVAKACLILDRPGMLVIFIMALITQIANGCFKVYISSSKFQANIFSLESILCIIGSSIVLNYVAIAMMVLVALLTNSLVSEQQSRKEAERLSKEVKELATELERTRIAQEIHDSLGHTLTSLNIQLEVARKFIKRDIKRTQEALDLAKQLASQSLTDVRTAIQSIRQPDFDLTEAINSLAKQMEQNQTITVNVKISAPNIPYSTSYQLFRVVQECLTNVMKHSQASAVDVVINHEARKLDLVVSDNGIGLPEESKNTGFGLKGMQERVESMHGTLVIESMPSKGTKLQVVIPL